MPAPSLLIIEDHDELRLVVEKLLTAAGYIVRSARDVAEALDVLMTMDRPCLVLWDPVSHRMSLSLLTQAAFDGIHIATIPVGIAPAEAGFETASGTYSKRLTSHHALLTIVKE